MDKWLAKWNEDDDFGETHVLPDDDDDDSDYDEDEDYEDEDDE